MSQLGIFTLTLSAGVTDTEHAFKIAVADYSAVKGISNRYIAVKVILRLLSWFKLQLRASQCSRSIFSLPHCISLVSRDIFKLLPLRNRFYSRANDLFRRLAHRSADMIVSDHPVKIEWAK